MISVEVLNEAYSALAERLFPSPPFVGVSARWEYNGCCVELIDEGVKVSPVPGVVEVIPAETARWLAQALYDAATVNDPRNQERPKRERHRWSVPKEYANISLFVRWPNTWVRPFGWKVHCHEGFFLSRALANVAEGRNPPPPSPLSGVGFWDALADRNQSVRLRQEDQ